MCCPGSESSPDPHHCRNCVFFSLRMLHTQTPLMRRRSCVKCRMVFSQEVGCQCHNYDDLTGVCVDCDHSIHDKKRRPCLHRSIVVRPANRWTKVCSV